MGLVLASGQAEASGIDPTKISLPKGPGSIEGLASADFVPSLSRGTASYEIPIAVPPGSAGFGPKLTLSYDSGGGVSELGIGWRIGGLPKVRRRTENGLPRFDDTDTFELVGIGIPSELVEVAPGTFRPAFEDGSFVRLRCSTSGTDWEARTKSGVTLRFGGDSFIEAEGDRTSAYLLREELDRHGHKISYVWDTSEGHALIEKVVWNDFDALSRNEVRFEYEPRPDRHRSLSNGILESVTRRLRFVYVRHGGELVRRYELSYGDEIHPSLRSIGLVGRDGVSRMPESRFEYTEMIPATTASEIVDMANSPGLSPKDPDATLVDLNGDGLPDLLFARAGQFRSYLNHDGGRWLDPLDWGAASPSVSMSAKDVEMADIDADGAADLVVKSGTDAFRYFPRPSGTRFDSPVSIVRVPTFSFEDPNVRLADMDGDRRSDVVVTTDAGIAVGYNRGGTDWTEPELVGIADAREPILFSNGRVSLCDVNGDRVEDLCSIRPGQLSYWLGRGRGIFEPAEVAERVPDFDVADPYQLIDLNGDGWVDLLRVRPTRVEFALAVAEGRFAEVQFIEGTPTLGPQASVHFVDMNASGTTDIVWVDVTGNDETSWRYLELFPNGRAGLLRRIDNGLGKVQTIEYEPAALHAARARNAGNPWATRINVPMPVVSKVEVDLSMGDPPLVSELVYRDGSYDPAGRTFAGFGGCTRHQLGDQSTPTLVSELTFDTGLDHRELRGSPLVELLRDESGAALSRTTRRYTSRALVNGESGQSIRYSFASSELLEHIEGKSDVTRSVLTEYEEDDHGNVVETRHWGEIAGSDYLIGNDEAFVERTFAESDDEWLLGYAATERITDGKGRQVSATRKYYDGPAFLGLSLGGVSRGNVSREETWVGPDESTFELVIATKYDADGLPIETRDGVGGGRFFDWASDHTSIANERVKLDSNIVLIERATVDGAFGTLLGATDYGGQTTNYEYDAFGRLTKVIKPGDSSLQPTLVYSYAPGSPLSRVVTETRVRSGTDEVEQSETLIDGSGRERGTLTRDGEGWILAGVSLFDARGNARRSLLPRGVMQGEHSSPPLLDATPRGSDTFRDPLGREIKTRSPTGIETRTEYAPLSTRHWDGGQTDARTPYEHTPTVERRDGLGRVIAHERTLGGTTFATAYSYDPSGALVSRTDPEGHVARYEYDGRGRRIVVRDPDLGDTRFSYDAAGNLVARTYPDGTKARFSFDLAGRSLSEDWNGDGTPELTRVWDIDPSGEGATLYRGKLARIVEPSGSVEHTYDERGRVTSTKYEIDGSAYVVQSEFDAQDREVLHVYPDGSSIEIDRNPRGQVVRYGSAIDIDYADDGAETTRRFNTGALVKNGHDDEHRRNELTFTARDGSEIEHLRWSYDSGGNVTAITDVRSHVAADRNRSESYTYDNLYRLSKTTGAWGTASYHFSPSGNLLGRTSDVAAQSIGNVAYGARPHLPVSVDGKALESDLRGRVTNDGSRQFSWNDADQLVGVSREDGSGVESIYGDEGVRRIRVEVNADGTSTTTHFIDGWAEAKDGKLTRYIVHGGQRIVRLADDNGILSGAASAANRTPRPSARIARAATASNLGALYLLAFALTAVLRLVFRMKGRAVRSRIVVEQRRTETCGGAITNRLTRTARTLVASIGILAAAGACGADASEAVPSDAIDLPRGSVRTLTDADTIIASDLIGSVLGEATGNGTPKSAFATYPFGATRFDTSHSTWKFAGTPRDAGVGLDHMGARFYAPDLGFWTSGDPVAIAHPERLVTAEFAAANPYAYSNLTPVVAADRDGHFFNVVAGAFFGGAAGAAIEAARQYIATGKIDDFGRIGAAAAGGVVAGATFVLNPAAGLSQFVVTGARAGVAAGLTERLVASGGKDAGTVKDVVVDAAIGGATGAVARGVTAAVAKVGPRVVAGVRSLVGTRTSNPTRNGAALYRYVTEGELGPIRDTGMLRGGNPGRTFFTTQKFNSGSRAQERLALPNEPSHRVEFEITNEPRVRGPMEVKPDYGQPGKGIELFSNDQVEVRVVNVQPLLKP